MPENDKIEDQEVIEDQDDLDENEDQEEELDAKALKEEMLKWKALSRKNEKELKAAKAAESKNITPPNSQQLIELAAKVEALMGENTSLKRKTIAEKYGLPLEVANRLSGDSDEDLEEDAKMLAEILGTKKGNKAQPNPLQGDVGASDLSGKARTKEEFLKMLKR